MELSARDMKNEKAVKFSIGELIAIKDVVFRVTSMSVNPPKFEVSPGNADHIKQYLNKTQPENVSKPALSEPGKQPFTPPPGVPEQPPAPPADDAPEPPAETQTDPDPVETGPGNPAGDQQPAAPEGDGPGEEAQGQPSTQERQEPQD